LSEVKPRTHVLLTGLDYERIELGLRMYPGYRVYVVKNGFPRKEHVELVREIDEQIVKILTQLGYSDENIKFWPVDFYHFDKALASIYELLLLEKKEGREPIINITSGTKLMALAATIAAALVKCGVIYFAAREYKRVGGEVVSRGVIPEPIVIGPLFELGDVLLPRSEEERKIILALLKKEAKNVKEILIQVDPKKRPLKSEIARYAYYVNKLNREKLVNIEKGRISLTELGRLVGMLLEKENKVKTSI